MRTIVLSALLMISGGFAAQAAEGERIQVKGEIIDTWCYYSGVMGGPDAVVGSAHHTCAGATRSLNLPAMRLPPMACSIIAMD